MGCELGKLAFVQRGDAGGGEKKSRGGLQDPPPPAPVDPRLPLTAKQKYSIVASWKGISRAMEPTGVNMFLKLFEDNAELLNLFDKFRELRTREQQQDSMELAEHAATVMGTLDEGIRALDNVDSLIQYLEQVGASHNRIPGFKSDYFWKIEKPFLTAVESTLGDRYTDNVSSIYQVTIKFIIETLVHGFEESVKHGGTPPPAPTAIGDKPS